MVDLRLQQLAVAQDFIAILLVILMAVVALLCCRIEGVVDVAFPDLLEKMKCSEYISNCECFN